jgi:hypothetical protein
MERPRDVTLEGLGKSGQTKTALTIFSENPETRDGP